MKMRGLGHHLTDVTVTKSCKIVGLVPEQYWTVDEITAS